ncbi:TonB-dependent receptor [Aquimarina brevivitae]|uniref:Outer membrane receptor protein involved in Fe transport n=1 Tax=Aquimarina brevivitae TaxID=323412 RepID=A0A4V2F7C9_9FLAO|nr:TonB-dependent receptor [Aquimarina brevivitae]RZS99379.1 outer membrane receptor protein involved in Fe transport [Aquimarina brevivitae]
MKRKLFFFLTLLCGILSAQVTTLTGKVVDQAGNPIPLVNVKLRGYAVGAVTNFDGEFVLPMDEVLPVTLYFSSVGYETVTQTITSSEKQILVTLQEGTDLDVVILSASRKPERIFESPVRVEYYGTREIKFTPSIDYYSGLENIKGVEVLSNSLTYKTVNTRGYGSFSNTRFVQLVDGMDNSSPSLNFSLGNLVSVSELDIQRVELLPGASSALYGANAFNGLLTYTSKNPFDAEGISAYSRGGVTSQDAAGTNPFYDVGIRVAKAFSKKLAVKANFTMFRGTDWFAVNQNNINNPSLNRATDPNYNGVNVYGDEVTLNLPGIGFVSRTGYQEIDLVDYEAESVKFSSAIHYRPFEDDFEIIYNGRIGRGTTIFQNANRFYSPNFFLQQHKLEIKNNNFFIRGYITDSDAGDTYDTRVAATNINNRWKDNETWYAEYFGTYAAAIGGGATSEQAHQAARAQADTGRLIPGTPEFQEVFESVINDPDFTTGAKFKDESQLRHVDANYNFSHLVNEFADIQVGGSFREYNLRSDGSIFTDADGPIKYSEIGVYAQIQKKFLDERLKFTGSVRYDKSQLFDGNYSPRAAVGYTLGEKRNHNIRASYQTGFRNPTTQNLYMGLDLVGAIAIGSAPENLDRERRDFDLSTQGTVLTGQNSVTITGRDAFENSYTLASALAFSSSADPTRLEQASPELVKPEQVSSIELGYRGKFDDFSIEVGGYYNMYQDFITSEVVIVPLYGSVGSLTAVQAIANGDFKVYNIATNTAVDVNSYGATVGVESSILRDYDLGVNYTYAKEDLDNQNQSNFQSEFNSPEHRVKVLFGNRNLFKNFGFNTSLKWSDSFQWNDAFGSTEVPSFTVIDAQLNYRIPKLKAALKMGATNIGGNEYYAGIGTGFIGSQYYIGLSLNNL